jgi:hypothetical protein
MLLAACPVSLGQEGAVAQVYSVEGRVLVTRSSGGSGLEVQKGCLLGKEDSLALEKAAALAVYFKSGGRKEVRAPEAPAVFKVAALMPRAEAYGRSVPLFGASRGLDDPKAPPADGGFFFPQEAVVLDRPPLVDLTVYSGSGGDIVLGGATVRVLKDGEVLDSKSFDRLEYSATYSYGPAKLEGPAEYSVEVRLELPESAGSVVAATFPLYIAGTSDAGSASGAGPFSDRVYRSFESTVIDHKGKKRAMALIKELVSREGTPAPVVAIGVFIP